MADPKEPQSEIVPAFGRFTDMTQLPTRADIQERFGVSKSAVCKWEKAGKLHGILDAEGTTRYNPDEVRALADARGIVWDIEEDQARRMVQQIEMKAVSSLVNSITKPREQIDRVYAEMVRDLRARVKDLEGQLDKLHDESRKARDDQALREAAKRQVELQEARHTMIWARMLGSADKFMNAKFGKPFLYALTPEQLEVLIEQLDGFWTKEQLEVLRDAQKTRSLEQAAAPLLGPNGAGANGAGTTPPATDPAPSQGQPS